MARCFQKVLAHGEVPARSSPHRWVVLDLRGFSDRHGGRRAAEVVRLLVGAGDSALSGEILHSTHMPHIYHSGSCSPCTVGNVIFKTCLVWYSRGILVRRTVRDVTRVGDGRWCLARARRALLPSGTLRSSKSGPLQVHATICGPV